MTDTRTGQPNVVVFLTDQQRWDTTGLHGNPLDLTPNFDRFARRGTHVANSFTPQPVCGPARACILTGTYATTTGCYRNGIPLPPDARTLAHHFREAGYATGYIGKWHLADRDPVPPEQRGGFEHWLASNILEFTSEAYRTVMYDEACQPVRLPGYRVDALTDAAIRFIDQRQDDPFLLYLSFLEPHHQNRLDDFVAPDGYRERYTGRWAPPDLAALGGSTHQHLGGYFGMVKRLDEAFGRLLDALTSLDLAGNTIVLFTSDHGCHFRTRNKEYKRSCHEASIRVPTAIGGPGFARGGELPHLVSHVDLAPTLLAAAGLPAPSEMQGRSLLPLINRQSDEWAEEVFVQISESEVGRAIRTGRWKYAVAAPDGDGGRDAGAERYVETHLYDFASDPYELTNLVGLKSHREVAAHLRERLIRRMIAAGEAAPAIDEAPLRQVPQRKVLPEEVWA
ncbi:MAG: sulfatase-like hydrolase/transferase [Thermomicrobiales bacterium]